jgi:hypothetical protein
MGVQELEQTELVIGPSDAVDGLGLVAANYDSCCIMNHDQSGLSIR